MKYFVLGCIAAALTCSAHASTSIVTFDVGSGEHEIKERGSGTAAGTWKEAGFAIDWSIVGGATGEDEVNSESVESINPSVFMEDNGIGAPFNTARGISFVRLDNAPFSLNSFVIGGTSSSWWGEARYSPGEDPFRGPIVDFEVSYGNLLLKGIKSNGDVVETLVNTFRHGEYIYRPRVGLVRNAGLGFFTPDSETARLFSNLKSLEVTIPNVTQGVGERRFVDLLKTSIEGSDLDQIYKDGFSACLIVNPTGLGCTLDGIGSFAFMAYAGNIQNWETAVSLGNFSFSVAPSPVPLPAGGFLLLTALAGGGALARCRRAA
jgi:hypothetical protein